MAIQRLQPSFKFNEEQLNQLRKIAPEAFKDNILDFNALFEALSNNLDNDDFEKETYEFSFPGKRKAKKIAATPSEFALNEIHEKGLLADVTNNIFIEGENLEVLKLLQKSYFERIKLIYIDPPYNTGKDFIYDDDFSETLAEYLTRSGQIDEKGNLLTTNTKADGRYHSKWLSMMYPRLKLARNLLQDDGVIFVSIDDNEVSNLRILLNEIFGEENFLVQLIWKSGRTSSGHYTAEHEYIVGYCKTKEGFKYFDFYGDEVVTDRAIKRPSNKNPISEITFSAGMDFICEDKIFPSRFGSGEPVEVVEGIFEAKNGKLAKTVTLKAAWTMRNQILSWLNGEEVTDQKGQVVEKFFFKSNGVLQYQKKKGTIHPKTIIDGITTKAGTNEILSLFGKKVFDFPKPTKLLYDLILPVISTSGGICLDFFAGSGSLGHAIYNIIKDNPTIDVSFILVQIPEPLSISDDAGKEAVSLGYKTISDVARARLELAANAIKSEKSEEFGFKYFKLYLSNFKEWENYSGTDINQLEMKFSDQNSVLRADWSCDKLLKEILLIEGFPLSSRIVPDTNFKMNNVYKVTSDFCEHSLFICLDKSVEDKTIQRLSLSDNDIFICLDNAVSDQNKAQLNDKGLIKTI